MAALRVITGRPTVTMNSNNPVCVHYVKCEYKYLHRNHGNGDIIMIKYRHAFSSMILRTDIAGEITKCYPKLQKPSVTASRPVKICNGPTDFVKGYPYATQDLQLTDGIIS